MTSELDRIIRTLKTMLIMTIVVVVIWNVLNFIIFQWFGFRYYGININTMAFAGPIGLLVIAPVGYGVAHQAVVLGVLGTIALAIPILIAMRWEAGKHREIYGG